MGDITIPVTTFRAYLDKNSTTYGDCDVISVTHSKNLNSSVLHEYLHLIIRNKTSKAWLRLLVERQADQDQVIIGLWPWVTMDGLGNGSGGSGSTGSTGSSGSSGSRGSWGSWGSSSSSGGGQKLLPLLMRNLRFDSLNLQFVANILLNVHQRRPRYNLITANCFWYADVVFQALRGVPGGSWYREWYARLRGKPLIFWWSLPSLRAAARGFQNQLPNTAISGQLPHGLLGTGGEYQYAGGKGEDNYGALPEAPQDMEDTPADFDVSTIEANENVKAMKALADRSSNLNESAIRSATEERKADIIAFSNAVLGDPKKEEDLKYFQSRLNDSKEVRPDQDPETSDFVAKLVADVAKINSKNAPSEEEEARYEEAICAFAGGVLREVSNEPGSEIPRLL